MENNNKKQMDFSYTYSASEQAELKKIRDKYTPPTKNDDKLARLRRLDASVTKTAQAVALILGIIGILVMGLGMSLCMSNLGEIFGPNKMFAMLFGIAIGIVGIIIMSLAYPIYNVIVKAKRKKLAPQIIQLADELLK